LTLTPLKKALGFVLLLVFASFYAQPNSGGSGLALTYNIPIWIVASWIIMAGILLSVSKARFNYPSLWLYLVIFPLFVIISSVLAEVSQPITWLFRQLYIFGGVLFLFALFQFQPKQKAVDQVLFLLVIATGLHALLGTMQIVAPSYLSSYFPPNNDLVPRGMFQQINVQVSYLATGLIISLYFISRPSFRFTNFVVKLVIVIAFTLAIYVVVASGSRVGLLSLLLAIPLVVWSRFHKLRPHKTLLIVLLLGSCGGFIAGQSGLDKTLDKTVKLAGESYSTSRVAMYTIGMELVAKEPIHGYGIGGFLKAWNLQASDFVSRHPETSLPQYVTHPHNEVLFWMIEAGLPALLGIIAFVVGLSLALYQCGFQRGGAYAAMLLPISLHTQVELPFYISSLHWFIWLFLIYLVLRHNTKTVTLNLSLAMRRLLQIVAVGSAVGVTLFMINIARAQADLYDFLYNKNARAPYLQVALNNLYTKTYAEQIAMRSMLYASIESGDKSKVETFENWALDFVVTRPELKMYEDLISASVFLRPEGKGCDAIVAGIAMYAQNKPLQRAYDKCQ
jgi:O-antigen polymerase